MGKGTELVAKSDIDCRHARESRMLAGGTITIGDHSVNSRVAAESIYAVTGRGTVVGGEVCATRLISLREAGSRASVKTILAVAVSEARRSSLARLWQDMEGCDQETVKAPAKQGGKEGGLSLKESERIAEEQRVLLQEKQQLLAKARIEISGTAHTGVRIRFAEHELVIKDPLHSPVFVFDQQANCIVLLGG